MIGKLMNSFKRQTINDSKTNDEEPPVVTAKNAEAEKPKTPLRKSARLSAQKSNLHDSGTESDDEELERLEKEKVCDETAKIYGNFLNSRSPPTAFLGSPPFVSELDTESWDSTGGESGITAGFESNDCSRESVDCPTPPQIDDGIRRGAFQRTGSSKAACEFPPMSMHNTGEKRRHSMTLTALCPPQQHQQQNQQHHQQHQQHHQQQTVDPPIASRLRSNFETPREIAVAARRTPVRVLVNRQTPQILSNQSSQNIGNSPSKPIPIIGKKLQDDDFGGSLSPPSHPAAKRGRTNGYGRPTLDLDKMLEHRFSSDNFIPACEDEEKNCLKEDWYIPTACPHGNSQPIPCVQDGCHFRPVEIDL
ncbi:unnamed protein product, partial [Mesorhabditis belari]|uniref:Uncharacterized protein n=1 Tax=Mesorhabditis belari TaxID=2138241 RepID=A0AAF3ESC1_9BILA